MSAYRVFSGPTQAPYRLEQGQRQGLDPVLSADRWQALGQIVREYAERHVDDRSLRATVITADSSSQTHIYDLSGGIDHLLDRERETKVYHYLREE